MGPAFGSIRVRLVAAFGLLALVLIAKAAYFQQYVQRQQSGLEALQRSQQAFFTLNRVANAFVGYQAAMLNKDSRPEQLESAWQTFGERLGAYADYDASMAQRVGSQIEAYRARAEQLRALYPAGDAAAIQDATVASPGEVIKIGAVLKDGFDRVDQRYKDLLAGELATQRRMAQAYYAITAATLALVVLYAAFLAHAIVRPLGATVRGIRNIRRGEAPEALPAQNEFREIGGALGELYDTTSAFRQLAFLDPLTGLGSRARFEQALADLHQAPELRGRAVAVVLVELPQMFVISSAHGPQVADHWLSAVARHFARRLAPEQALSRYGDIRLAFLLPLNADAGADAALAQAEALLDEMSAPLPMEGLSLRLEARAGVARWPEDGADATALLAAAETALATARGQHERAVVLYERRMAQAFRQDLLLAQELERAVAQDELLAHFEPIVDIERAEVIGVEALVRWQHPARGLLLPAQFVPLAERSGQIIAVDARLFERASAQLALWRQAGRALSLAFNVSARELSPAVMAQIRERVLRTGLPPGTLVAELTETAVLSRGDEALKAIHILNAVGAEICLDDFGTGYSSLSYLLRLPIARLKVDRSFVAEIGRSSAAEKIIEATIYLAATLGVVVVGEGVETVEQMRWLAQRGCCRQQGWLYARAQAADGFERWMAQAPEQLANLRARIRGGGAISAARAPAA